MIDKSTWKVLKPAKRKQIASQLAVLAKGRVRPKGVGQQQIVQKLSENLDRSEKLFIQVKDGRATAAVYQFHDEDIFPGLKVRELKFAASSAPRPSEVRWMMAKMRELAPTWNRRTIVALRIDQREWTKKLKLLGFGIEFVILQGETAGALKAMRRRYGNAARNCPQNISLRSMRPTDMDAVIQIKQREFRKNPRYGWMCATKTYLEIDRKRIGGEVKDGKPYHYIFEDQGTVIGYFGICPNPDGKRSGVELAFDRRYQGRGLAIVAYTKMLELLSLLKIPFFQGGTSHPAVLRLATVLQRKPIALIYRFGQFENHLQILKALQQLL